VGDDSIPGQPGSRLWRPQSVPASRDQKLHRTGAEVEDTRSGRKFLESVAIRLGCFLWCVDGLVDERSRLALQFVARSVTLVCDPGRGSILTATSRVGSERHQDLRCAWPPDPSAK
jgi:hypothetical protein